MAKGSGSGAKKVQGGDIRPPTGKGYGQKTVKGTVAGKTK